MSLFNHQAIRPGAADPFHEHMPLVHFREESILGGRFVFHGDNVAMLGLVEAAYGGLKTAPLPVDAPRFDIELRLLPRQVRCGGVEPPPVKTHSGAGLLCGTMDANNYVVLAPAQRRALVVASEDLLDHPYHLRYELIEFAVFVLAARGMGLVPLHGGCVGSEGRGVLLLGGSGAGKSTLALQSLREGMTFLAEDAVFVHPRSMRASGVGNFVHVTPDGLRFLDDDATRRWIADAPVIRRRSGVEKFEADLRLAPCRSDVASLPLGAAVFVSSQMADDPEDLLDAVPEDDIAALLLDDQPYAAGQPGWDAFVEGITRLGAYRLRRGRHPRDAVAAIRRLCAGVDTVSA